jgi:hypothetical protein
MSNMKRGAFFQILLFVLFAGSLFSQNLINYSSVVGSQSTTDGEPVGYGIQNLGPYSVHDKLWVFYSDGQNIILRTKQIEEGGEWSSPQVVFSGDSDFGWIVNIAFDGKYFHFVRHVLQVNKTMRYSRGKPEPDGSLTRGSETTILTDNTWGIIGGQFSIEIDYRNRVWVTALLINIVNDDLKRIVLASIDTTGGWVNRTGFPKDITAVSSADNFGLGGAIREISPGKILITYRNEGAPANAMVARLWTENESDPDGEGTMGSVEVTGLPRENTRTSLISPSDGVAILNSGTSVARRNADGTWTDVSPGGMLQSSFNTLSVHNGEVRLWDNSGNTLRYKSTTNNGSSWGGLVSTWSSDNLTSFTATHPRNSRGSHHSLLWRSGASSPYNIVMGIDGDFPDPESPVLISPANNDIDVVIPSTLEWSVVNAAQRYHLQVSEVSNFSTFVYDADSLTNNSQDVSGLDIGTVYYWRVRSITEGGTIGEWSDTWSFTTVGIPPKPVLLSPANGATAVPTSLTHSWESINNVDNYWLQISTDPSFATTFIDNNTIIESSFNVNGLDNDVTYYWRVRASNEFGSGDWSDVWSFATGIAVPSAPILVSPENEAVNQPIALTLDWEDTPITDTYRIQVSIVSNFSSTIVNIGNLTSSSHDVSGLNYSTTYYWRVQGTNETGTGSWSSIRSFTTIIEQPETPTLASPENSAVAVSTKPELSWNDAARAETYRVQVATDSAFGTVVFDESDIESLVYQFIHEIDPFSVHYWRVRATNIGGTSEWSDVWEFTTGQAFPIPPPMVSPENGSSDMDISLTLLWSGVETATAYQVQVTDASDFSSPAIDANTGGSTFYNASGLSYGTQYYWRVRAISGLGAGDWSEVWSFTTRIAPPPAASLLLPEDGATNVATSVDFSWEEADRAVTYHLQVSTNDDFSSLAYNDDNIDVTEAIVSGLANDTQYYWRVRGNNSTGNGDWSPIWSFTTDVISSVSRFTNEIPEEFGLAQNYPNPLNPTTTIRFALPVVSTVRLEVFNMLGQRVTALIDGETLGAGIYEARWDGNDDMGRQVSSGTYIYRVHAGDYVEVKKMIYMK